ncbi:SRPBCC family protein [Kineococcus aurantiacus]|uniref:SRPBCC family protein n=1 Tax=Kineococcus aurantiacus TaxID=37633 RepID=A0A7Y9AS41_9ACTN|nr:cyclase/dehydrase [Kineococcus aurantiacus]NYD20469.1 hypothetical protein [Kineococcus aurantiacus]
MAVVIEVVTDTATAPAVVFDLELDVEVHAASLSSSDERATTGKGRRYLQPGDEVTSHARHFGLPWRMTSRITPHDPPPLRRRADPRPFRSLHHEHFFDALPDEASRSGTTGTRMTDRLSITAPADPLGAVVARLVLAPHLWRLLRRRAAHVKKLAESASRRR